MKALVVRVYGGLLNLYPQSFRQEFADEMQTVFSMRLDAVQGWERVALILLEIVYLMPNILREHHTQRQLVIANSGGVLMSIFQPKSFYRWSMGGSIFLIMVVVLLVMVPFFLNGIHQYSYESIYNALYDPKGFAPFNWGGVWENVSMIVGLMMLSLPVWCGVIGFGLGVSLYRNWQGLDTRARQLGRASLLLVCLMGIIWALPAVQTMLIWILD